jgi:hypothetical protein
MVQVTFEQFELLQVESKPIDKPIPSMNKIKNIHENKRTMQANEIGDLSPR